MSHLSDPHRLPRTVVPSRYELVLSPRLEDAAFGGTVRIEVEAATAVDEIVLNAAELSVASVLVNGSEARWHLDEGLERLVVERHAAAGPLVLDIAFTGTLNDKLRGFYRSTFTDDDGTVRTIATTQMQATDCRRAFPCFDEPDFKAVFSVELVVAEGLMAVSNGRETSREAAAGGLVRVRFADTMPMSTYLVAFVVGPLEATEPVMVNDVPLRIVHVPGKAGLTDFGLRVGAFALDWFQTYYGIPYPSDKVDLIALPDFASGAMENVGCITFREVLLLVDPTSSTQMERQLVADVVAHELAHMWFGDLVTMKWWNGIWLNEAFATFMEVAACDAFAPEWKRWTDFGLERTVAFDTDSLHSTRSVEFEVKSPADADAMFDVLTYQKGGALLRMLEQYLGPDRFRAGVSHYLRVHSYGNTETSDLWDAIEHVVSSDSGPAVPVRRLMDSWIWQPGYPLVSARVEDGVLVLDQCRFSFDRDPDATVWVVPIHLRIGGTEHKVLLEGDETRVPMADAAVPVVVNAGGHGFYRVAYSPELLARITGATLASLDTLERYTLVDDAWNSVVSGTLSATDFLSFAEGFRGERDLAVWQSLAIALRGLGRILPEEWWDDWAGIVRDLVSPALADLGLSPRPGDSDLVLKLRGLLVALAAVQGADEGIRSTCRTILFEGSETDPELVAAATTVVAATGTAVDYEWILARFRDPATPQEQIRMLYALAEFPDPDLIARTCELAMSGEVKSQNAPFVLNRCIANRRNGELAWRFVREHWEEATERFPGNTIIRMVDTVKLLNSPALRDEARGFFSEHPIPQAGKVLDQVLERQGVNVELCLREADALADHLGRRASRP